MESIDFLKHVLADNNNEIKFGDYILVKSSPHKVEAKVTGIFLFDDNVCYEAKENNEMCFLADANEIVINTILQRIKWMKHTKAIL